MPKSETEWERAFAIHKNCDQLLHQRLASFTALQAFAIGAYIGLTLARFQVAVAPERVIWFEISRGGLILFGIITAIFGWMVTFPMLVRIRYLNEVYLFSDPLYKSYMNEALLDPRFNQVIPGWPRLNSALRSCWRQYRNIIPIYLPMAEIALWIMFLLALSGATISTWVSTGKPPTTILQIEWPIQEPSIAGHQSSWPASAPAGPSPAP